MCLVEVKPGPPKPQASCALPVADKQEIFTTTPMVAEGAQGRDGVPAHQPSARLPDLRPGRRVRPAGPGDGLRLRPQPLPREQARGARQGTGAAGQDVDEPLHPLHALHPLRHRGGGRRGAGRDRPRRGHGGHDLCRACAHHRAGRQSGRSLPGRRADLQALRLRGAVVGAHQDRIGRRAGRARRQYPRRHARRAGDARAAAPQRRRERGVDLRQDAPRHRRPAPPAPRPAVCAPRRQARRSDLGRGLRRHRRQARQYRRRQGGGDRRRPVRCRIHGGAQGPDGGPRLAQRRLPPGRRQARWPARQLHLQSRHPRHRCGRRDPADRHQSARRNRRC